jgi:REP element-mobilizing transposase RayT
MPNHLHGIIILFEKENDTSKGPACRALTGERFGKPVKGTISTIMRSYKSAATKRINELNNSPNKKLWHRNYFEHIIRNETDLNNTRNYIRFNPLKWTWDKDNPERIG